MHGSFSSNQGEVVLDWAIDGHGIVLLSERDVATQIAEGKLVRLLPDYHEPAPVGHDERARGPFGQGQRLRGVPERTPGARPACAALDAAARSSPARPCKISRRRS